MFQFMQFCKKNFFFCNFLKVENFPPKWKNFHFASLGSNLANAKVQNPKTKFRQSGKFSTKSGKISTSAECSNSCDFGIKNFFFGSGKFSTKVEKIPLPLFGIKLGVLVCPDEQKNFSAKVENFPPKVEILFDTPR